MTISSTAELNRQMYILQRQGDLAMNAAVDKAANLVVARMKALVPKKTGNLADSIVKSRGAVPRYASLRGGMKRTAGPGTVFITAGDSAARYAHLVEFDTKPHVIAPRGRKVYRAGWLLGRKQTSLAINGNVLAPGRAVKHPGTRAKPFFFVAFRAEKRRAYQIIRLETRRQILDAISPGASSKLRSAKAG